MLVIFNIKYKLQKLNNMKLFASFIGPICTILSFISTIAIGLKICNLIEYNWLIVLSPFILLIIFMLISIILVNKYL